MVFVRPPNFIGGDVNTHTLIATLEFCVLWLCNFLFSQHNETLEFNGT
jgi:hypothetical protein